MRYGMIGCGELGGGLVLNLIKAGFQDGEIDQLIAQNVISQP